MQNNNRKVFETFISRTKIYLAIILVLLMFIGRVGPLTMTMAMTGRIIKKEKYRYPKDNILIG